jgi:hypothetical protein
MRAAARLLCLPLSLATLVATVLAMIALFVIGQLADLWDTGLAADEDTRAAIALPGWWPLGAAVLLIGAIALSAIFPWGFAS